MFKGWLVVNVLSSHFVLSSKLASLRDYDVLYTSNRNCWYINEDDVQCKIIQIKSKGS